MADIADHLVPRDGLTNSYLKFTKLLAAPKGGGATIVFTLYDEDQIEIGEFDIAVAPRRGGKGTVDEMIARAHRKMTDVLRQWIYMTDKVRQIYETPEA